MGQERRHSNRVQWPLSTLLIAILLVNSLHDYNQFLAALWTGSNLCFFFLLLLFHLSGVMFLPLCAPIQILLVFQDPISNSPPPEGHL